MNCQVHIGVMAFICLLFTLAIVRHCSCTTDDQLNDFVKHYETVNVEPEEVVRVRRSVEESSQIVSMKFKAFGRSFHMHLRPDTETFTPDAVIERADGKPLQFNRRTLYVGELDGEPNSFVHGSLVNGHFEGKIGTDRGQFFVESASKFFKTPRKFSTVIYRGEDVEYEAKYPDIRQRMPQPDINEPQEHIEPHRSRRATSAEMEKSDCLLWIGSDHTFTEHFSTYEDAIREIADHVQAAGIIFKNDFDKPDLYPSYGLGFRVKKLVIYDKNNPAPRLKETNLGVDTYLETLSQQDFSDYCAAFMFTNRNFDGGILGLAWIGYASGKAGGICSKYSTFSKGKKTYNTGLVTFSLYKKFVPRRISEITFAHELGHSFGSQHDPEDNNKCVPGSDVGNYIMYAQATSGNKANNNIFSPCSINEIKKNVDAKRSSYRNCFTLPDQPICGNLVIEKDEQCDCGDENTCKEKCCEPKPMSGSGGCSLKSGLGYTCSPSQGPCCNNITCQFNSNIKCREEGECNQGTYCNANSVKCPAAVPKDNITTVCNGGRSVCLGGECTGSICLKYNLDDCPCSKEDGFCHICCRERGFGKTCMLISKFNTIPDATKKLTKSAGSPCKDFEGYCDAYGVCREINKEGPLKRLWSTVLTVEGIKEVAAKYWWAILLGCIVFVVFVALLIKLCTIYTPSSNPVKEAKRPHVPLRKKNRNQIPSDMVMS